MTGCGRKLGPLTRAGCVPFGFPVPESEFALRPQLETLFLFPPMALGAKHDEIGPAIGLRQSLADSKGSFVVDVKPSGYSAPFAFTARPFNHFTANHFPAAVVTPESSGNPSGVRWPGRTKLTPPRLRAPKGTELILASLLGLASFVFVPTINALQSSCWNAIGWVNEFVGIPAPSRTESTNAIPLVCVGISAVVTVPSLSTPVPVFLTSHRGIIA